MNKKLRKILISISVFSVYFLMFKIVGAADTSYKMLEPIPGIGDSAGNVSGFGAYLSGLFKLSIGIAAVLAILMLSVGGFEYTTTEAFTGKSEAKKRITNAIYGLILIISAYLLLQTINPDLVNAPFEIPKVGGSPTTTAPGASEVASKDKLPPPTSILVKQISPIGENPSCENSITQNGVTYGNPKYEPFNYSCNTTDMSEQNRQRGCCLYQIVK